MKTIQPNWTSLFALACVSLPLVGCDSDSDASSGDPIDDPIIQVDDADLDPALIGMELSVPLHLEDGDEFTVSTRALLAHGERLFNAPWTTQEGQGRPLTKGTGAPLSDPNMALVFPNNMNRVSAMDANSCQGCHNAPVSGGGGDFVTGVFVLGQRFDDLRLDGNDSIPTATSADENGDPVSFDTASNYRATLGMSGSGYVELLAREMTVELQERRNLLGPAQAVDLVAKGVSFGRLIRNADGTWNTSEVEGLVQPSLASTGSDDPPNLIIRPFHQASNVVSLRQFSNNAYNHHHGIQSTERFGVNTDQDGDGMMNEMTRADVTAVTVWQAALPPPGQLIPRNPAYQAAVQNGEEMFEQVGCTSCHRSDLELESTIFTEPNPFNPEGNLLPGQAPTYSIDLSDSDLPGARLPMVNGRVRVPAYTDLKVHDITTGAPDDPNREPLDMNAAPGSPEFNAGNSRFITKKLWGAANEPPYFHHGLYTTLREAILAHSGEALQSRQAYEALPPAGRNAVIEFLKSLQVLPETAESLVIDSNGQSYE